MKVMQLLSSLCHDDSERGIYHIAHALIKEGHHSIVVACANSDDDLAAKLIRDGSYYHKLPIPKKSWWSLRQVFRLKQLILHHQPHIIHVHSRTPAWVLHWALKLIKQHTANHPRTNYPKVVSSIYGFYTLNAYSQALFYADTVIVASKSIKRYIDAALENDPTYPNTSIACVYRGVDVRLYPYRHKPSVHWLQHILAEFPQLEHKKWLIFPTRIGAECGQEWLIDIIGNLKAQFANLHIIVMDNDNNDDLKHETRVIYDDFRQRLNALQLNDYISFVGANPIDLKDWLSSANLVLALANRPQSISMTTLQAIHLGTPVLGWDKGAFGDILKALYPDGLITKTTAHGLCQAIRWQLSTNTRPIITKEYEIQTMVCQTIDIYQQLYTPNNTANKPKQTGG